MRTGTAEGRPEAEKTKMNMNLKMKGRGIAFGAATIVNAMPSGFGAALGVDLKTCAEVELTDEGAIGIEVEIAGDRSERKELAEESFRAVLGRLGLASRFGARIRTESEIPVACGMKSSSAASNAVVLATLDALGVRLEDSEIIGLGVDASLRAKTTLTGAFDDACASYYGGLYVTDNYRRRILRSFSVDPLIVLFLVPAEKRYSGEVDARLVKSARRLNEFAFREAVEGRYWQAMLLNGLMMSDLFKVDPAPIVLAIKNGAVSAGLCGKGPAICAVVKEEDAGAVADGWSRAAPGHRIIRSAVNSRQTLPEGSA